jgi:hypothetical protein
MVGMAGFVGEAFPKSIWSLRFQRAACYPITPQDNNLDARVGVEPTFQRSERRDLPLVDPAMNGCPSRNRTYDESLNRRPLCH